MTVYERMLARASRRHLEPVTPEPVVIVMVSNKHTSRRHYESSKEFARHEPRCERMYLVAVGERSRGRRPAQKPRYKDHR